MAFTKKQENTLKGADDVRFDGVMIGVLVGINDKGEALVIYPSNPNETAINASTTTPLNSADIGKEVALLFEGGNPNNPLIIGRIQQPKEPSRINEEAETELVDANIDGEHVTLTGKKSITLKCGKASITLTQAGKIIIRGDYILSRSSGVNKIKGGSVQLN